MHKIRNFSLEGKTYRVVKTTDPGKISVFILDHKNARANSSVYSIEGESLLSIKDAELLDKTIEELSETAENDFRRWREYVKNKEFIEDLKKLDEKINPFEDEERKE